jgi:hypothetical protein
VSNLPAPVILRSATSASARAAVRTAPPVAAALGQILYFISRTGDALARVFRQEGAF